MAKPPAAASVTREDRLPGRKRPRWLIIIVSSVVLVVLGVVVVDRGAVALAQHEMAAEIKKEGFPVTPDVTIKGVPFLTQVASRDFDDVRLSAKGIVEGPLRVTSLDVRARDVHIDDWGFSKGTLGSLDGTAFVSFGDLAKAGGEPGLDLSANGPNQVRAKVDLGVTEATALASVTKEGNNIRVKALSVEGFGLDELGDELDFTVPVSGLPLGLAFQSLTVTSKGVGLHVTGKNVKFSDR
ncbi:LmeA family phospholipid-binding protein [Actinomadura fibrosa]|uniref:DUF2993 domain-containing protein n=1 Tax=Actinomadura fibrosa TaxID=111802 RepID=A0ABW2XNZ1_9ACTN|nr:DUF2993 domain-containing protein [Actinomadura fibrosa]